MQELFFLGGSAAGATLAWLVERCELDRSLVTALTGLSSGLLGVLVWVSDGTMTPMTQAGVGLLGAAAPMTLCTAAMGPVAAGGGVAGVVRRFSATLALSLICGIGCAVVGFSCVGLVRHVSHEEDDGQAFALSLDEPRTHDSLASALRGIW